MSFQQVHNTFFRSFPFSNLHQVYEWWYGMTYKLLLLYLPTKYINIITKLVPTVNKIIIHSNSFFCLYTPSASILSSVWVVTDPYIFSLCHSTHKIFFRYIHAYTEEKHWCIPHTILYWCYYLQCYYEFPDKIVSITYFVMQKVSMYQFSGWVHFHKKKSGSLRWDMRE